MPRTSPTRLSTNPVRISMFEREDKSLTRNDQRRTQTLKKGISIGESSHIPRPRFKSSSSDQASGRKSHLKITSKTPLHQSTTPVTPKVSVRVNLASLTVPSSSRSHAGLSTRHRSPSGERASSVGVKGPRKDTRPLIDKTYQTILLNKIDHYFFINQCSTMLNSNGSLKPITLKMFVEVSDFLLKFLDIKQNHTLLNYVEEFPKSAKKLHYPGLMTKSWLKTANTMHSWPYVLGWIGWLVEICQVKQLAFDRFQLENIPFLGTEKQAQSSHMEFLAMLECYKAWNDERLDDEKELLEKYLKDIEIQGGVTEEDIAQATKKLKHDDLKSQAMENESKELEEEVKRMKEILPDLHAKEAKKLKDFETKEEYIEKGIAEKDQLYAEYSTINEQVRIGEMQYEELSSTVRNQPMSKMEKNEIITKCTEMKNYIHEFNEHLKDYQKELYTSDIELAAVNNNLKKAVLVYNKEMFMHIDNDIGTNFDELKLPEKGLLDPQIMNVLEEKGDLKNNFKELLIKQCKETEILLRSDIAKLDNLQEKIKSLADDNKLKKEKAYINKMKTDSRKEEAKLISQMETLKNEINEIHNMIPDKQTFELEIEEAKDKLDAMTRRKTFLEQSAKQFFNDFYQVIGKHRKELRELLMKNSK